MADRADGILLARLLANPALPVPAASWTALLRIARHQRLMETLALRLQGLSLPEPVVALLAGHAGVADRGRVRSLWEARLLGRDLAGLGCPLVLLKGSAYHAANMAAGLGRSAGDIDIMVPRSWLGAVEAQLAQAGWQPVKTDPYDEHYYRQWMHEVPPLRHDSRELLVDLHHTILPLTARVRPDAQRLFSKARPVDLPGWRVLSLPDMVVHSALHLFQDGDMEGGLRNLWDIHCLIEAGANEVDFAAALAEAIEAHGARRAVYYAFRYAHRLFGTPVPVELGPPPAALRALMDRLIMTRLADADWLERPAGGRLAALLLYIRSHWLRMPPLLLARHLAIKAWRRLAQRRA